MDSPPIHCAAVSGGSWALPAVSAALGVTSDSLRVLLFEPHVCDVPEASNDGDGDGDGVDPTPYSALAAPPPPYASQDSAHPSDPADPAAPLSSSDRPVSVAATRDRRTAGAVPTASAPLSPSLTAARANSKAAASHDQCVDADDVSGDYVSSASDFLFGAETAVAAADFPQRLLFQNLLLLGFDPAAAQRKYHTAFHHAMFARPNPRAAEVLVVIRMSRPSSFVVQFASVSFLFAVSLQLPLCCAHHSTRTYPTAQRKHITQLAPHRPRVHVTARPVETCAQQQNRTERHNY